MKLMPNFHFAGNCLEAIDLYKKVFDAKVICLYKETESSKVYHAELMIGNTKVLMTDADKVLNSNHPLSLLISFD